MFPPSRTVHFSLLRIFLRWTVTLKTKPHRAGFVTLCWGSVPYRTELDRSAGWKCGLCVNFLVSIFCFYKFSFLVFSNQPPETWDIYTPVCTVEWMFMYFPWFKSFMHFPCIYARYTFCFMLCVRCSVELYPDSSEAPQREHRGCSFLRAMYSHNLKSTSQAATVVT